MNIKWTTIDIHRTHLKCRRTKIVATVGPVSDTPETLERLIRAGADVFRVNFSHGKAEEHAKLIRRIRTVAAKCGQPIAVLADLCGPKIRVGEFEDGSIPLKQGEKVFITSKPVSGRLGLIPSQYKNIEEQVRPGHRIFLDDGLLELKVLGTKNGMLEALVVRGGILKNRKGMNMPDSNLKVPSLTLKDRKDAKVAVRAGVDYLALSFVRSAEDLRTLRNFLSKIGASGTAIIAKIETPQALGCIGRIFELSDGVMVARGDLGVELPPQKVPLIQNELIRLAARSAKPVIVATQMMESMVTNPRPTRAEVTDVASACLSGADAVMLSAETAAGKYPVETVAAMDSVLAEVEAYQWQSGHFSALDHGSDDEGEKNPVRILQSAISAATAKISRDIKARCVCVLTRTGTSARLISSDKPAAPVFAFSADERTVRRLNLMWGVLPFHMKKELSFPRYLAFADAVVKREKIAKKGDPIILLSGLSPGSGITDSIVVRTVG